MQLFQHRPAAGSVVFIHWPDMSGQQPSARVDGQLALAAWDLPGWSGPVGGGLLLRGRLRGGHRVGNMEHLGGVERLAKYPALVVLVKPADVLKIGGGLKKDENQNLMN